MTPPSINLTPRCEHPLPCPSLVEGEEKSLDHCLRPLISPVVSTTRCASKLATG